MKRIIIFVMLVAVFLAAVGCSQNTSNKGIEYNLYFANQQKNNLEVEKRSIPVDSLEKTAEKIVKELVKGPASSSRCAVIPADTILLDLKIVDKEAVVNFNKNYYPKGESSETQELLARYSLVNTLCDIDGIQSVKIFVEGAELVNSSNVPVGSLSKKDIILNGDNSKTVPVKLYFPDKNAVNLVGEERKVTLVDNSLEKTVMLELVKGPQNKDLIATIPSETKVLSVETKDGLCFVNLSSEFISKHGQGSAAEAFTVYSIVNSLTELAEIKSVQFLIEGKKAETLKHMLLDSPYKRNEEYIEK